MAEIIGLSLYILLVNLVPKQSFVQSAENVETSETLRRRIFFVLFVCSVEKGGARMLTLSDLILLL